jgi:coenzyme F420-0:L-glutamate ligase / coenzyme F420-1:gamma-L-glutamate ligase
MTDGFQVRPVRGIGDVTAGDDLVELIATAAPWLAAGDILVVTSKIVSKAEGRLVEVPADGPERDQARHAVLAAETARVVARRGPTTIVQTHHGFVMAAAGIDASNVDKTHLVLLPADPDASARRLRAGFLARGLDVAVIVSDTMGRAWRNGLTDVALGAAGIAAFRDHRGETDPYGNELHITQMAVIDELAAAGDLVKGKRDQVPVAVIRGYPAPADDEAGARPLLRDPASDMFSLGTTEARTAGLLAAAQLPDGPHPAATQPTDAPQPTATQPTGGPHPAATQLPDGPHPAATQPTDAPQPAAIQPTAGAQPARGDQLPGARPATGGAGVAGRPVDPDAVRRAVAAVAACLAPGTTITEPAPSPHDGATAALHLQTPDVTPAGLMRLGADSHRLRAALAAEAIATIPLPDADGIRLHLTAPEETR